MDAKNPIISDPAFSSNRPLFLSLVWRVLFICLFFIVVPLIVYSFLLYEHVSAIKQQEAFIELGLFAEDQKNAIDEKINDARRELHEAKIGEQYLKDPNLLSQMFHQMTSLSPGEMILLVQKSPTLGWVNIASSEPALLGMKPPCEFDRDLGSCSWQGQELIILREFLDETNAILYLTPVQTIIYPVERAMGAEEKLNIRLFYHGNPIGSSRQLVPHEKVLILPYDNIFKIAKGDITPKIPRQIKRVGTKIPIENTDYEVIIDAPLSLEPVDHHVWRLLSSFILIFVFVGGGLVFWLIYKMSKPLNALAETMSKVEEGTFDIRYQPTSFGFEINRLGYRFNNMLEMLQKNIVEREKHMIEKEKLAKELAIGHAIQKSLFPHELPHLPQIEISAGFHPANRVAGDFYDLHMYGDKLLIVMADAAGKGISACLFSLSLRGMLRSAAESGKSLQQMVESAHKLLKLDAKESGMFITAWIGVLDLKSMELTYLSQGHYPAILGRNGTAQELDSQGSALGIETHRPFAPKHIKLQKDDLVFLYTDGLVEALRTGRRGILEKFQTVDPNAKSSYVINMFTTPPPYEDDLTLLCLRIN
jgi:signal transduction histidine kinase